MPSFLDRLWFIFLVVENKPVVVGTCNGVEMSDLRVIRRRWGLECNATADFEFFVIHMNDQWNIFQVIVLYFWNLEKQNKGNNM